MLVFGILCGVLGIALLLSSFEGNVVDPPPEEVVLQRLTGIASHYGMNDGFHGRCMADGRMYNKNLMTAAHRSLPLGTKVRVSYKAQSVLQTITDRGPYIQGRIIDLSEGAARKLDMIEKGIAVVAVDVLEKPARSEKYHHGNIQCLKA